MKTLIVFLSILGSLSVFADSNCSSINEEIFKGEHNFHYLEKGEFYTEDEVRKIAKEMMPNARLCYTISDVDGMLILDSYFTDFSSKHVKIRTFFKN